MYLDDGGVVDPMVELEQIPRDSTIDFFPNGLEPYVEEDIKRWRQDRLLADVGASRRMTLAWIAQLAAMVSALLGVVFLLRWAFFAPSNEMFSLVVCASFLIVGAVTLKLTRKLAKDQGVEAGGIVWAKTLMPEEGVSMVARLSQISDTKLWVERIRDDARSVAYCLLRADHSSGRSFYFYVWDEDPTYMGCAG